MARSAFINDGHTRDDVIPAGTYHPEVTFTYRPMLRAARNRLALQVARLLEKQCEEEATKVTAKALAEKIVSWDITDTEMVDGQQVNVPVEVSAENMARLEPNLFEKMYRAIAGYLTKTEQQEEENAAAQAAAKNS